MKRVLLFMLVMVLVVLAACASPAPTPIPPTTAPQATTAPAQPAATSAPQATTPPAATGATKVVIAIGSDPSSLDPQFPDDGNMRTVDDNIYEVLIGRDPKTMALVPI